MEPSPDAPPAALERLPSWLLTQTATHAHRLVSEGFAAIGGRGYHFRLLASLAESGPASQADLGRRNSVHLSDMVAAINELAARGLVARSPDPSDRRRNIVSITPAGRDQLKELQKTVVGIQDELLAPLSAAEREQLAGLLGRVLEHHRQKARQAAGPGGAH